MEGKAFAAVLVADTKRKRVREREREEGERKREGGREREKEEKKIQILVEQYINTTLNTVYRTSVHTGTLPYLE